MFHVDLSGVNNGFVQNVRTSGGTSNFVPRCRKQHDKTMPPRDTICIGCPWFPLARSCAKFSVKYAFLTKGIYAAIQKGENLQNGPPIRAGKHF